MVILDDSWQCELIKILNSAYISNLSVKFKGQEVTVTAKTRKYSIDKNQVNKVVLDCKQEFSTVQTVIPVKEGT